MTTDSATSAIDFWNFSPTIGPELIKCSSRDAKFVAYISSKIVGGEVHGSQRWETTQERGDRTGQLVVNCGGQVLINGD